MRPLHGYANCSTAEYFGLERIGDTVDRVNECRSSSLFELIDFIAAGTTPERVIAFRPSATAQVRVEELIANLKDDQLSADEQAELDYFFQLEHIVRMAKARAEQILTRGF